MQILVSTCEDRRWKANGNESHDRFRKDGGAIYNFKFANISWI